ncbi:trypsin-like serine protease [Caballeronia sp. DA-9]|uniref:trypsin-like serine protease n=1 Tax=Caballeronia sp. DA-9 TaxID=3436237 RepID=UPI003F679BFB
MSNSLILNVSAIVLTGVLSAQSACFAQALPFCPGDTETGTPQGTGFPAASSDAVPAASIGEMAQFDRANAIDKLIDTLPKSPLKARIDSNQVKSLSIQDRAKMFADVDAATQGKANVSGYKPSTQKEMDDVAQSIGARQWVIDNSAKIDPRVLSATLGGDPAHVSGAGFVDRTQELGALAMSYAGAPTVAAAQRNKATSTQLLTAFAHNFGTAQVYPGTDAPRGALGGTPPHVPVVVDKTRQCLQHATGKSWAVNPALNRLFVAFDPAGFSEVGMLLHRFGTAAAPRYDACSLTLLRTDLALSAAHCTHVAGASGPVPLPGISDAAQFIVLVPKPNLNDSTRDPTACFAQNFDATRCQYYVGTVVSVAVPPGTTWSDRASPPSTDLVALSLSFPSGSPAASAQLNFSPPAKNANITLSGYGLTNVRDVGGTTGNLEVGWQTLDSVTTYGLSWTPSRNGRESSACFGDSGGPIFIGDDFGAGERHQLIGVVSFLDATGLEKESKAARCEKAPGYGVLLAPHEAWLCGLLGGNRCSG